MLEKESTALNQGALTCVPVQRRKAASGRKVNLGSIPPGRGRPNFLRRRAENSRSNALFYKTPHGFRVGDLFMSLIRTSELKGVNSFRS